MPELRSLESRGVLYMLSGNRHLNVLVVSLYSLRQHWQGPVHIAVGDDAPEAVVKQICADRRLEGAYGEITWHRWQKPSEQRGDSYRQKTFMRSLSPFDQTAFLDADTLVAGSIEPLFCFGPHAVTLTQFSDWQSSGPRISSRVAPWIDVVPEDVAFNQQHPLPAINTGILAFDKSRASESFFAEWMAVTARKVCFICDELAAQLIFHRHAVRVLDARWNSSPIHDAHRRDAVIYHFHGKKHVNREQGRKLWLPPYDECVRLNLAGIADWSPLGDKRLREFLDGRQGGATFVEEPEEETEAA